MSLHLLPTSTAFIGPTLWGPLRGKAPLLTSLAQFERVYGAATGDLRAADPMSSAVAGFFVNGGQRLYVSRVAQTQARPPRLASYAAALKRLARLSDVDLLAAPGLAMQPAALQQSVRALLLAEINQVRPRKRVCLLEAPPELDVAQAVSWRASLPQTDRMAAYYPWLEMAHGDTLRQGLSPAAVVCALLQRGDAEGAVWKAPDFEIIGGAQPQRTLRSNEIDTLTENNINAVRSLQRRGVRVWGSRTLDAAQPFKYLPLRRYVDALESAIRALLSSRRAARHEQLLWTSVRDEVESLLQAHWPHGGLHGRNPGEAFFVRCDLTTMTAEDINAGRLILNLGVALLRPSEFEVLSIEGKVKAPG
ncbi:MAG TPA: phage tail sheath subtilisin-like domain-containing protein [Rubrivivax sp.]|nr:phage tail sheath subtilisin-like domain-containing protein [Rubrivivax sp.]